MLTNVDIQNYIRELQQKRSERFCEEYLTDANGTQAAIRAGYSPKTANEQAARLLVNVSIQNYIRELQQKHLKKCILYDTIIIWKL